MENKKTNKIKIWCDVGILNCKNVEIKFTEYGIMIEDPNEEIFIPYGSIHLVRYSKNNVKSRNIKLEEMGGQDCI